mgnify:CR=1 FL=1
MKSTRQIGKEGEDRAVEYLLHKGYRVVSRNYSTRKGEIDCIAFAPDNTLVFIEVKCAEKSKQGHPFTWVNRAKQKTIAYMAQSYLTDHDLSDIGCRFDVIAVCGEQIEHLPDAFWA